MNNDLLSYILSEVRECELPENAQGIHKYLSMYTKLIETNINYENSRHWVTFDTVVQLENGIFVMFRDADTPLKGISLYDTDWEFNIHSIVEVEPYLTQVTSWKPKE